jgi:hypothetical protein
VTAIHQVDKGCEFGRGWEWRQLVRIGRSRQQWLCWHNPLIAKEKRSERIVPARSLRVPLTPPSPPPDVTALNRPGDENDSGNNEHLRRLEDSASHGRDNQGTIHERDIQFLTSSQQHTSNI